jgi:hypothetical protein
VSFRGQPRELFGPPKAWLLHFWENAKAASSKDAHVQTRADKLGWYGQTQEDCYDVESSEPAYHCCDWSHNCCDNGEAFLQVKVIVSYLKGN